MTTEDEGVPIEDWPWRHIIRLERIWLRRMRAMPRCDVCGQPMVLGQKVRHKVCDGND